MCPWHGFDFDLRTGRCHVDDGLTIPVYPARAADGAVEVDCREVRATTRAWIRNHKRSMVPAAPEI